MLIKELTETDKMTVSTAILFKESDDVVKLMNFTAVQIEEFKEFNEITNTTVKDNNDKNEKQ